MATTEKDKTPNETWYEQTETDGPRSALPIQHDMAAHTAMHAYEKTTDHCRSSHSGSMPSENEDTKRANGTRSAHP